MKKKSDLKNVLITHGDIQVDLILKPSMQVHIKAAGEEARYEVSPLMYGSPSVAISQIIHRFCDEHASQEHSDLVTLKGLEQATRSHASGLPIMHIIAAGWSLPVPADFKRRA